MSIPGSIDERLWLAVQASYESGDYSGAILDSVFYLSELIRNKSALDSDGNSLVGSALGGANPIIKVNSLHTESERDEQRGVEQLLRGIYTAIRNPRTHEKRTDSAETADTVITFIGWIAGLIDKSKSPFDTKQIIGSVFDKHFAQNERYADLLVARIPTRKRLDVLVQVFQRRMEGNCKAVSVFTQSVLKTLSPEEQDQFWQVVSEELESVSADAEFRSIIQVTGKDWVKISELARIRAEHRLIESIKEGEYDSSIRTLLKGSLGTWARDLASSFTLKKELADAISERLQSEDPDARSYVFQYFFSVFRQIQTTPSHWTVWSLKRRLTEEHDKEVYDNLSWVTAEIFADDDDPWIKAFRGAVKQYESTKSPQAVEAEISDDDIPF
jgi:uncharacterized protein (TIGR02391 family)